MLQITPSLSVPRYTRYCANCKHFLKVSDNVTAKYEKLCTKFYTLDLVEGNVKYENAFQMRDDFEKCGPQARHFEGLTRQDNLCIIDET